MIAADELLEEMRGDTTSDWPDRLLEALAQAPLVDEADLDRANLAHDTAAKLSPAELRALVACSHGAAEQDASLGYRSASPHARIVRESVQAAILNREHASATDTPLGTAGAPEREPDATEHVAAVSLPVVASERDTANGDGVEHTRHSRLSRWQEQRS